MPSNPLHLLALALALAPPLLFSQQPPTTVPQNLLPNRNQDKVAWKNHTTFPLTLAMARQHVISYWQARGFSLKHEIPFDSKNNRYLMLWQKNDQEVMVLLWKIDVDQTGCSWGTIQK